MNHRLIFSLLLAHFLLLTACGRSPVTTTAFNTDELYGSWVRKIPGTTLSEGYHLGAKGFLGLVNIFSMMPDSWSIQGDELLLVTHTERYPEPQPITYIIESLTAEELVLASNGQVSHYHRPTFTTNLTAISWLPKSLTAGDDAARDFQRKPFVQFTTEGKVSGFAGCNQFNGNYHTSQETLSIGPLMTTRMYCPAANFEQKFLQAISEADRFLIVENQLYLYKEKNLQAAFQATENL